MRFRRKELRNNPTKEEALFWKALRKEFREARFRRQYSVGYYILDFYSIRFRIAIELDGNHHLNQQEYDRERDLFLESSKISVLRFPNYQVRDCLEEVLTKIRSEIMKIGLNEEGSPL